MKSRGVGRVGRDKEVVSTGSRRWTGTGVLRGGRGGVKSVKVRDGPCSVRLMDDQSVVV